MKLLESYTDSVNIGFGILTYEDTSSFVLRALAGFSYNRENEELTIQLFWIDFRVKFI